MVTQIVAEDSLKHLSKASPMPRREECDVLETDECEAPNCGGGTIGSGECSDSPDPQ
jgi:hypothetical protein